MHCEVLLHCAPATSGRSHSAHRGRLAVDAHEAGLSAAASVNTSASTSDLIIIMNILITVRLNKSMTKFVANAFSNRFLSIRCCSPS